MVVAKSAARVGPKHPQVVVLVGATGDLSQRKLIPGLYHLCTAGFIPDCRIIGLSLDEQLSYAILTVLARGPDADELSQLHSIYAAARERYGADAKASAAVAGQHTLPQGSSAAEWAAWLNVAHVLLNLDETITKN